MGYRWLSFRPALMYSITEDSRGGEMYHILSVGRVPPENLADGYLADLLGFLSFG